MDAFKRLVGAVRRFQPRYILERTLTTMKLEGLRVIGGVISLMLQGLDHARRSRPQAGNVPTDARQTSDLPNPPDSSES